MKYIYLLLLLCLMAACQNDTPSFDEAAETEKILALHHDQRRIHFEKRADEFVAQLSDNFISVNRGEVTSPSREDNQKRFQAYFDAVEFVKWDDLKEPIISFSEDGTMAYTIVEKEVAVRYPNEDEMIENTTTFAWLAIYKKHKGEWKIDAVTSTNLPDVSKVIEDEE